MTPVDVLILVLEDFQKLAPLAQLSAATSGIVAFGGSIFWAWRTGRKNAAQLVESNGKLKQELKDSTAATKKIERLIDGHRHTLALLRGEEPAQMLAQATTDSAHARDILRELFEHLSPAVAICCREMATVEVALTLDAGDRPHLQRAARLAEAAVLLAPERDAGLRDLLAEINAILAVWAEEHGEWPTASELWNTSFDYVGGGPDVDFPLLQRLQETGIRRYREGHYAVAAVLHRRAALLSHRNLGREHPETLKTRNDLALAINAQGRPDEAEAILREVLALQEKVLDREHPDTQRRRNNLAVAINAQGRPAEAEAILREVLALQEKVLDREHPDTQRRRGNLATAIHAQGRSADAEAILREVLALQEKVLDREHPDTLTTRGKLALAINAQGRPAEAEAILAETVTALRRVQGDDHPDTKTAEVLLAKIRSARDGGGSNRGEAKREED